MGKSIYMKIPAPEIEMLDDGMYRISVGKFYQFVSSTHLFDQHINQLNAKYKAQYDDAVQPYLE